ncbi:cation-transporting P-type ATPase [Actinocrinis puniceicyclus]|uniref:Cation-transporting P-type ATPase n=1 Tax=Actinocrinis puniceicyclus TaxID=977794 RepID=A0A8J7WN65_9ACTN|nr:cation-transporting P-type ATPase [Actinocrinis puniceicyclus]MBS2965458.1 cation-transporting P-type ATPase [Actinocrinis puniceicyclus]
MRFEDAAPSQSALSSGVGAFARDGLSAEEAGLRLARDGRNALPQARRTPLWRRVLMQLRDPLVAVLLVAAALTIATGDWTDAGVILLVIVVNTSVGVAQEVKADQAITALDALTAPHARVVRGGRQAEIPADEVVVGDLLALAEGQIVPADARVLEAAALLVDESALTGESVPVGKAAASAPDQARDLGPAGEPADQPADQPAVEQADALAIVSAGTVVVRGRGLAVVTATGTHSAMGRIAALMTAAPTLTPLQRRLVGVGRALALAAVVLCTVVLGLGLARGQSVELMVVTAISLVVAAVPESLPAVVTLALALGARRMTARQALVRRLPAVEALGSVTVLATDKTGTLTEGVMVARRLWTPDGGEAQVSGSGYAPEGQVTRDGLALTTGADADLAELLTAGCLCNDASLRPPAEPGAPWTAVGDPTEAALLAAAARFGVHPAAITAVYERIAEVPFESGRRRMTTLHKRPDGGTRVVCKGAPEAVLRAPVLADCATILDEALRRAEDYARDGLRVLAVAYSDAAAALDGSTVTSAAGSGAAGIDTAGSGAVDAAAVEQGLHLLGLIAILDPPRASAAATVAACQAAGIIPVMITGDHPATARTIAVELGILERDGEVVDCRHLAEIDPVRLRRARVFARAVPEQKLAIVEAHQAVGDVVAMTGDGVNDAPALRRADIGVAMGRRGTEVARQASDLVLADDELGTVVAAAQEGRRVYANIRRFLLYGLAGGTAEIAVMLIGPLFGLTLPLLPSQILWVNLLTHGLPGVALGSEPVEPGAMLRPPRPPAESVLGAGLWQRILRVGAVISAVTLGVAVWGHSTGRPWQSMAFFALGATQLTVGLASRARPGTRDNPLLPVAIAGALVLQLAGLYVPVLQDLLNTQPLSAFELLVVAVLSSLGYVALKLDRLIPSRSPADRPAEATAS